MGIFQRVVTGNIRRKRKSTKRKNNLLQVIPVKTKKKSKVGVKGKRNIGPGVDLKTATIVSTKKIAMATRNPINITVIIRVVVDRGAAVLRDLQSENKSYLYKFLFNFTTILSNE